MARIARLASIAAAALTFALPTVSIAQNLIPQNTTIHDKLCVGSACANTESYSSTVLKLKDPLVRLLLDDTSGTGSPSHDWTVIANDYFSGGENYLSFGNATLGTRPFTIKSGARDAALVLAEDGKVGLGTAHPQASLDIWGQGFNATIELEASAFYGETNSPRRYRLNATADQFEIGVDGTWPFAIIERPDNARIVLTGTRVGSGTYTPQAAFHILRQGDDDARILVEDTSTTRAARNQLTLRNNGTTWFTLEDTSIADTDNSGRAWNFQNQAGSFRVTTKPGGPGEIEMLLTPQGDLQIKGQLFTGTGGGTTTCFSGCDTVFDEDYHLPAFSEHMAAIRENGHLPAVGPTPENGPHNLSQMVGGTLNELEKAYLYIDALQARVETLEAERATDRSRSDRLAELERIVQTLTAQPPN